MANETPDSQTLFSGCFNPKLSHKGSILACLSILAETMKHEITDKAGMGYVASLNPLSQSQLVQAFSRALDEAKFFPVPALLRDFASFGDPVAAEAREELFRIVTAMRGKHASRCATFFCDESALGKPAYIVVTNYVAIGSQSNVTEFR
jgi:hypothetical protein